MRTSVAFLFCFACGIGARGLLATNLAPPPMPRAQAEVYARVASRVLAPCCWSQPIQTHQSEAAERVRAEVIEYVRQGDGEEEILDRLAAEYGERILGEPRGARGTVAFATPFVILAGGFAGVIYALFRLARRGPHLSTQPGLLPELPEMDP